MHDREWLTESFEVQRAQLHAVAFKILGSASEADDAVQETWLRLHRSDVAAVHNMAGWLRTVVGRVCLDVLRSRRTRREDPLDSRSAEIDRQSPGPEDDAVLADQVGLALMVVLETLSPDERLAFVLHDSFGVPHRDIATILDKTEAATKMLASRARRRVQGIDIVPAHSRAERGEIVAAFLVASREGDFERLLSLLHPDVVVRADATAAAWGAPDGVQGADAVAEQLLWRAQAARLVLIDGSPGAAWAPSGQLRSAYIFTIVDGLITAIDVVAEPARLHQHEVTFIVE